MYYVYILKSRKDDKNYIGATSNLSKRIKRHNDGFVYSTRHRTPLDLLYYEEFEKKEDAFKKEKFYKSKIGSFKLKEILKNIAG